MKTLLFFITTLLLMVTVLARSQGMFIFDQQSSTDETPFPGSGGVIQDAAPPFGQSFTASLSAVDIIRLNLNDHNPGNGLGATLHVVLHSDSMSGPVLGSTMPVSVLDGSATITTFLFPATIALTPNTTYYFEVIVQPIFSDSWNIIGGGYNYSGGSAFVGGLPTVAGDLWFREGIIVPEPSSALLLLLGSGFLFFVRRKHRT